MVLVAEYINRKQKGGNGQGRLRASKAGKQAFAGARSPLTRDKKKRSEVDLGNRCEEGWLWEAFLGRSTWPLNVHFSTKSKDGNTESPKRQR
jgi:hypothetical protein